MGMVWSKEAHICLCLGVRLQQRVQLRSRRERRLPRLLTIHRRRFLQLRKCPTFEKQLSKCTRKGELAALNV